MSNNINIEIGGRNLSIEIGKVGRQADGSALVRYGDTIMLVTATSRKEISGEKNFLPLIVDYRENTYAAGKIPGGFFKREGKPSEREILVARMIDRPIRPLFPEGYFQDTQIVALLLSADLENEPDTMGIIGASVALYFSEIPFTTPLGAVKVGLIDDQFVINPTASQLEKSKINMVVAGNEDGICMIEAGASELEEEKVVEGLILAQEEIKKIVAAQKELFAQLNIAKTEVKVNPPAAEKIKQIEDEIGAELLQAIQIKQKKASERAGQEILNRLLARIPKENTEEISATKDIFYNLQKKIVRDLVLNKGQRADGRAFNELRPISIEVGLLPRTHGSALFTRGETQSLATVTLGTFEDVQRLDGLGEEAEKRFMLHYNFPPFSVGEVSFMRAPGRREIGHGALAEKALLPAIPDEETFPYTIRIVSDILESNGSSSMATVCGGTLALLDAGVPLKMVVAGIAVGLVKEGERYALLTDIAGLEDHYGDMDFKVTGSEHGITAIQMDLKIPYLPIQIIREAFQQSREARLQVLEKMKAVLPAQRPQISVYAPRIITLFINPEKVSDVIGPAGKMIKKIVAQTNAKIDIEETGKVTIASTDMEAAEKAREMIREITTEVEIGQVYTGKVVRLEEYGAFVEILPNIVGLLHISEVAPYRIRNIKDEISLGQTVTVKVIDIDEENNRIRLSKKALEEGDQAAKGPAQPREREDSHDRHHSHGFPGHHSRNDRNRR
ncbi:MAG TPA: polyribonucleotide nucleotidyltransferase [Candidatus Saccharicenans sp.]|jgi:polyribonucleotide nucleotidyltransferase|nr:polyribonucleotide nucleotidyltransferase [Candidatus Saccharicenans sp.]HOL44839.1 polyribonucleotide nucleotidyltransferase [Candidatus Saccharicenans sp.]HOM94171.1 polyribonucleotide nucleotidyltransferase [Candidatus Saccharicenans sp.]HOT68519.1 polyribonucleotide nucleotidyltransferase [Candidatus Saccharicenans sp.]HPC87328.1 polyribonucleotide nucleotidyltransferase [Candidatus Saccharicenans sp.]